MKKNLILCMIVVLVLNFYGCASTEDVAYNTEETQDVSKYGISFQVPEEWEKSYDVEEYLEYSIGSENGDPEILLAVMLEDGDSLDETAKTIIENIETAKKQEGDMGDISRVTATIAGLPSEIIQYDRKIKKKKYFYENVLLETQNGIVLMGLYSLNKSDMKIFDEIIDSIVVAQ